MTLQQQMAEDEVTLQLETNLVTLDTPSFI